MRASILDFRARLGNRCKLFPVYTLFRASILDFKPKFGNRCSVIAAAVRNGPLAASVAATSSASGSNFRSGKEEWPACGLSWRTQAGTGRHEGGIILSKKPPEWCLSLPSQVVRVRFYSSLRHRRTARVRFYSSSRQRRSGEMGYAKQEVDIVNLLLMNCQPLVK